MNGVSLDNYKLVQPRQIAYVPDTSRRGDKVSLGFNNTQETFLVSSIYIVFGTNTEFLLPEFLMLFFQGQNLTATPALTLGGRREKHSIGLKCAV